MLADVGQGEVEEVNVGAAANYGWPCWEGTTKRASNPACDTGPAMPVLTKNHGDDGFCSITGGYVVRDPGLPTLAGRYVYGDFCARALRSVDLANPGGDASTGLSVEQLSSFGEDACGRVLVVSLAGPVYRLVDGTPSPCGARRRRRRTPARARCRPGSQGCAACGDVRGSRSRCAVTSRAR